ncbi:hypothetical protein GCM10023189_35630 [Nibrella saemangeumensis]|uniref:Transposase DDE domain-containing protein n=1 Tax=Nibrella saemangeumensis TaxID=1084526 RepID=A0ABP8N327_9BACT
MKTGFVRNFSKDLTVYRRLRRQVVAEFKEDLAQATGWRKDWVRWKRWLTLQSRYNELLFQAEKSVAENRLIYANT